MGEESGTAMTDMENYLETPGRDDQVKEVRRQIDAQGIEYIYYQFASVTGRVMGKGVPAKHWESMARKGFQLVYGATANLFVDRHGDYIGYGPESRELVGMPDPDLLIRTAGEMRVSNFLLWQISYAELWVTEAAWPDFDESHLAAGIASYAARDRRFGGLSPK